MRIAIVHYTKPPTVGGVERVVGEQAAALRSRGHDVEIVTRGEWREANWDAVIVHNVFTMPFDLDWTRQLAQLAAATARIRWINWVHDVAAVSPYYAGLPWNDAAFAVLRRPPPNARHVAVSESRREDYCRATGLPSSECVVIPNGIDAAAILGLTPRMARLFETREFWRHDLVLLQPARLLRRKNIELGIRVTGELRRRGWKTLFVVTGAADPHQADGATYFSELQSLVAELALADHVLFAGRDEHLDDADVRSLYQVSDALFFPSKGEGFGLPLLEAVMHRLPVFCTDIAAHREVGGRDAVRFPLASTPEQVAGRIVRAMEAGQWRLARRRVYARHAWSRICKDYLEPLLSEG